MERATKAALTTPHLKESEVEIEGVGSVLLRALSRWEMTMVQGLEGNRQQQENMALHLAMVDPPMEEFEVLAWRKAGGNGEIESIAQAVNRLSGIGKDAQKSGVDGDGAEPGA